MSINLIIPTGSPGTNLSRYYTLVRFEGSTIILQLTTSPLYPVIGTIAPTGGLLSASNLSQVIDIVRIMIINVCNKYILGNNYCSRLTSASSDIGLLAQSA